MESRELGDQLQAPLGSNYAIEREPGRGGMSCGFVATEKTRGRAGVVKVRPPELAHAVSVRALPQTLPDDRIR